MLEGLNAETAEILVAGAKWLFVAGGTPLLVFVFARWVFLPMWQAWCGRAKK